MIARMASRKNNTSRLPSGTQGAIMVGVSVSRSAAGQALLTTRGPAWLAPFTVVNAGARSVELGIAVDARAQLPAHRMCHPDLMDKLHQIASLGRGALQVEHQLTPAAATRLH